MLMFVVAGMNCPTGRIDSSTEMVLACFCLQCQVGLDHQKKNITKTLQHGKATSSKTTEKMMWISFTFYQGSDLLNHREVKRAPTREVALDL